MLETFPYGPCGDRLEERDFLLFQHRFRLLISSRIPAGGNVYFVAPGERVPKLGSNPRKGLALSSTVTLLQDSGAAPRKLDDILLLPFRVGDGRYLVAMVTDVDSLIVTQGTEDWLMQCRDELQVEFIRVKRSGLDPETGLLNSEHFFEVLRSQDVQRDIAVLLIYLPARSRTVPDVFRHTGRAAALLLGYADSRFLVHHLGQGLFGLLTPHRELASLERYCAGLVNYLRREGMYRAQVGASGPELSGDTGEQVLSRAWTALKTAARRGPFSFCDYGFLARADQHPLRRMQSELAMRFHKLVRGVKRFSLILLNRPTDQQGLDLVLPDLSLPEGLQVVGVDRGLLLFMPHLASDHALAVARDLISQIGAADGTMQYCAGISTYPLKNFSRSETLENARKALLHAELLGPGQAVEFDAISLNVSGDIHFSDGDLCQSLREYRRGVLCAPDDVNLLNSLGVTYALLNRNGLARTAFSRVLDHEPNNFMALYNLGLGSQLRGDNTSAIDYLVRAYSCCPSGEEESRRDIDLQLGKLYCLSGSYPMALEHLERWCAEIEADRQGEVARYIGEAYLATGRTGVAMQWLQRAQRNTPYDPEVLSLLGSAIWQAGEGAEIGMSLCAKAVDLAHDSARIRMRLARVQQDQGFPQEALANLAKCRGSVIEGAELGLLKAELYAKLQQKGKAKNWASKVLQRFAADDQACRRARELLDSLEEERKEHGI